MPNLLDIAKINGADEGLQALVDEAARVTPELTGITFAGAQRRQIPLVGDARTIKGTQYTTLIRTGLPTFQFRDANQGVAASASTFENRLVSTFIADMLWKADKAVADACEDGAAAYIASEAGAIVAAAMMGLCKQFYYGRGALADAKGHPGVIDFVDASLVVDATGTTDNVASSVYGVKWGPDNVRWVFGNGAPFQVPDPRIELVTDPADATKQFTAYVQNWVLWAGVQCKSKFSVGRIKKLTTDVGKGLTDALLAKLVALYPVGTVPDCFFATRRSIEQLRASRTATNATGAPAPTPTEYEGIPIVATDSLLNTETLAL
jgi:hypothetical protein